MTRLFLAIKRSMLLIKGNAVGVVNMILLSAVLLVGIEIKDIAEDASSYAQNAYSEASDASSYAQNAYSEASAASSYAQNASLNAQLYCE